MNAEDDRMGPEGRLTPAEAEADDEVKVLIVSGADYAF
jgi:hypothetical protein